MNKKGQISTKLVLLVLIAAGAVFAMAAALLVYILQRQQEAKNVFVRGVELTDRAENAEEWGKNFPF